MLNSRQRAFLSSLANSLTPTVMVGKDGLSEGVKDALSAELSIRELVKVRFVAGKEDRNEFARALCASSGADLVRVVGNTAILFRPSPELGEKAMELPR